MQYGLSGGRIKGLSKKNSKKIELGEDSFILCIIFITSLLLSRVTIMFGEGDISGVSPFGLAFLISIVMTKTQNKILSAATGAIIGYFTVNATLSDGWIYLTTVLTILGYTFLVNKFKKNISVLSLFLLIFLSYTIYNLMIVKYDFGVSVTISILNTVLIVPVYFVVKYSLRCIGEYNTNYFFNTEEIISIAIIICLMAAGIGEISIVGVSIKNIISLAIVISIAYIGGSANGAAIGITMGVILGITSGDMISGIGIYGSVGLIVGLFKDTGKIFSFLSSMIVFLILSLYSKGLYVQGIFEILIGGFIFLLIPKKILKTLELELCKEVKIDAMQEEHLNQIKDEFTRKVQGFENTLGVVSKSLRNISDNDKLSYKNRSTALIENLADRVCENCENCNRCWDREFTQTYNAFQLLLKGREEGRDYFPMELEKKCINKYDLIRNSEDVLNILNANEITKRKLSEGRILISNHLNNMSNNLYNMVGDIKRDIDWCLDVERIVRRELNKNSIKYKEVFCFNDKGGKVNIKINMEKCSRCDYCIKNVLPVVNKVMKNPMMISDEGCRIKPNNKECSILLKEMPKYKIKSYAGVRVKEGEQYTGDTCTFGNYPGGKYVTILSDGMGSGPEAGKESKITVDLVEKFIEEGLGINTALETVNSIMSMKFEEDEKFATLDLNTIDLYTGKAHFYKVGAAASFIKRGNKINKISSNMPPFGLVDKIEVESVEEMINGGDLIITLSDGVLDVDKDGVGDSKWLEDYLIKNDSDPKDLAMDILEYSRDINGGKIKDDMTIIVSKVYSVY